MSSECNRNDTIQTEFETEEERLDGGVEKKVQAAEDFIAHGERIERETDLQILEDGGVHISQKVEEQNIFDSLTLGKDVVRRLVREVEK